MSQGKLRRALDDATLLFVVPITAAVLPWRFGFALLKWVSRRKHVWTEQVDIAWQQARACLPGLVENEFKQRLRLLMLVDRCDSYLTYLRGRRWWQRQVDVQGDWPQHKVGHVLVTSHWGAGHWIWCLLAAQDMPAYFLVRHAGATDFGRGRLALAYLRWRQWAFTRIGGLGLILTGASSARVLRALTNGKCVVGMLDVPADPQQRSVEVRLLGRCARLRLGLAALAERADAPVLLFSCGLDFDTGRRRLYLETLPAGLSAVQIVEHYAAHVDTRIKAQPEAWQAWPHASLLWSHQHDDSVDPEALQ